MRIRNATMADLEVVTEVESICFPPSEAAKRRDFEKRLAVYPDFFWLLEDEKGRLLGFVNGLVSDELLLRDEMYADASFHKKQGAWQMIFGVNVLPEFRRQGLAEQMLRQVIADAKEQGRKGLVLTCKDHMVHYYEKLGFVSEDISESTHGGALWYDMRLTF